MRTPQQILTKNIKLFKGKYPDKNLSFNSSMLGIVYNSMVEMALEARKQESMTVIGEGFKSGPRLLSENFSFWLKRFVRNMYARQAQLRADTENYKVYCLQGKGLTFKLISTRDFKFNKAVRVFKKDLTAKEMEALSCYIAYPKKR